ncbi:MAG: MerR family DNA-binding transcriptional regulator [Calothrix sp. MO_192.B10]|nr:MerR family DNA-binding transcriptional regulator [Calothrix sp. MO_192.B10]
MNYKPHEFAKLIGVSVKTLQRWDNQGKLPAKRTASN